jgi:hypothetical protein
MTGDQDTPAPAATYLQRHLQFGWWSLLCFLSLGIMLEGLHGFKVGWYLEAAFETRRLMWTLGHAHGTLVALVNLAFGFTVHLACDDVARWPRFASPCLMAAGLLLPGGFFLGGIFIYDGDPGFGIFLVPLGALFLLVGVLTAAVGVSLRASRDELDTDLSPAPDKGRRRGKRR